MLEVTPTNARIWSRIGSRAVFGQAILALAKETDNLMVLSADLGSSSGLGRFQKEFPEKYLNVGISEQNMIGVASGLAKDGFTVFATSFAPFISMRASEQIRMNLGYMKLNVKAVSIGSGVAMGFLGNSHYGIEDASIMRSIPNLTVVGPADCAEIVKSVFAAATYDGPIYLRLTGSVNNPTVYKNDYDFEIGKAVTLCDGSDITIFANGSMVYESLQAAKVLQEDGLSTAVVNMHTIKPLDRDAVDKARVSAKLIVSTEEHSIIGGLGSAIAEHNAGHQNSPPHLIIGLPDLFSEVGEYRYLLQQHRLTADQLVLRIKQKFLSLR